MQTLLYPIVLTLLTLISIPSISYSVEENVEKKKVIKKATGLPFRGKISAVDPKMKTVSLAGKKTRTFQITSSTKIKRDGQPITLDQVLVGESVGGYALRSGTDLPAVVTLNIRKPKTKGTKASDKKVKN